MRLPLTLLLFVFPIVLRADTSVAESDQQTNEPPRITANIKVVRLTEPVSIPEWDLADRDTKMRIITPAAYGQLPKELEGIEGMNILATPTVTFLSGKTAQVSVGQDLYFDAQGNKRDTETSGYQKYFSGVQVTLDGTVKEDEQIVIDLQYLVREFQGFLDVQQEGEAGAKLIPVFEELEGQNEVSMPSGSCIALGRMESNTDGGYQQVIILLSAKVDSAS